MRLYSVGSENGVFVRMIQRVRLDLEETERLIYSPTVKSKLVATPGKLPWIKGVILSTKETLNEIGRWVERVRSDKEGHGSISWENRVRWVFSDNEKLANRSMELGTCHQALSTVLAYLSPLEQAAAPLAAEPPEYQDATFLDDLLSPRQRRRKARDLGRREEGTVSLVHPSRPCTDVLLKGISKETQKTQALTSAVPLRNPIAHYESRREEDIGPLNDVMLSQNPRHYSLPTPSASERLSFIPPVSSPTSFPISNTKSSSTKPAVEEWSSNQNNPLPATILSPKSTPNILRKLLPSGGPDSPKCSTITEPSATTSLIAPWAQVSSPGYVCQAVLPASRPSPQSWQTIPSVASVPEGELNQRTASQQYLNTSHNPFRSPSASTTYSLPPTHHSTPAPQYGENVRLLSPVVHSTSISSCQSIPLESPYPPGYTLQAETQNFSATNNLGPINIFELYSDPEPQVTLSSQKSGLEPSKTTHLSLHPGADQCPRATYPESIVLMESLPEMMAELAVQRSANQVSLVEMPNNLVVAQSPSDDSFKELSTKNSWEQTATCRFEMSADTSTEHFAWPDFITEVPAEKDNDMDEQHFLRQRAISNASTLMETSPPADSRISHSPYEYDQHMASWSNTQAQVPPTQPRYHVQYQYQAYSPTFPELTSQSAISSVVPSPILSEQRNLTGPTFTWPPVEAPTPVQSAAPTIEQRHPHSKSMTMGEARRINQRRMLNLMGQGYMGDTQSSLRSHR